MTKIFLIPLLVYAVFFVLACKGRELIYNYKYKRKGLTWYPKEGALRLYYNNLLRYTGIKVQDFFKIKYALSAVAGVLFVAVVLTNNSLQLQELGRFKTSLSDKNPIEREKYYTEEEMRLYKSVQENAYTYKDIGAVVEEIRYKISYLGIESELTNTELIRKTVRRLNIAMQSCWNRTDVLNMLSVLFLAFFGPEMYINIKKRYYARRVKDEIFFSRQKYILLAAANIQGIEIIKILGRESKVLKDIYTEAISAYYSTEESNSVVCKELIERKTKKTEVDLRIYLENIFLVGGESVGTVAQNFLDMNEVESLKREREVKKKLNTMSSVGVVGIFIVLFLLMYYTVAPFLQFLDTFTM